MKIVLSFLVFPFYFISSIGQLVFFFLLPSKKARTIYSRIDAKDEEQRIQVMRPFVSEGDTILDVGAGSGRFGQAVQEQLKVKVTGVDVCDYSDHTIPFFVYDGRQLPFPDKSFDVVFFAFVLHHTRNQENLIREAKRVTRRHIIVFEDGYDWFLEKFVTCWNDYQTNIFQGWIKAYKGYLRGEPFKIPMPLTFRSGSGWVRLFEELGLEVISHDTYRSFKPRKKVTFCLRIKCIETGVRSCNSSPLA
jgi:ubiquinone/menaquinone biosynthesis C-methylase UbiE